MNGAAWEFSLDEKLEKRKIFSPFDLVHSLCAVFMGTDFCSAATARYYSRVYENVWEAGIDADGVINAVAEVTEMAQSVVSGAGVDAESKTLFPILSEQEQLNFQKSFNIAENKYFNRFYDPSSVISCTVSFPLLTFEGAPPLNLTANEKKYSLLVRKNIFSDIERYIKCENASELSDRWYFDRMADGGYYSYESSAVNNRVITDSKGILQFEKNFEDIAEKCIKRDHSSEKKLENVLRKSIEVWLPSKAAERFAGFNEKARNFYFSSVADENFSSVYGSNLGCICSLRGFSESKNGGIYESVLDHIISENMCIAASKAYSYEKPYFNACGEVSFENSGCLGCQSSLSDMRFAAHSMWERSESKNFGVNRQVSFSSSESDFVKQIIFKNTDDNDTYFQKGFWALAPSRVTETVEMAKPVSLISFAGGLNNTETQYSMRRYCNDSNSAVRLYCNDNNLKLNEDILTTCEVLSRGTAFFDTYQKNLTKTNVYSYLKEVEGGVTSLKCQENRESLAKGIPVGCANWSKVFDSVDFSDILFLNFDMKVGIGMKLSESIFREMQNSEATAVFGDKGLAFAEKTACVMFELFIRSYGAAGKMYANKEQAELSLSCLKNNFFRDNCLQSLSCDSDKLKSVLEKTEMNFASSDSCLYLKEERNWQIGKAELILLRENDCCRIWGIAKNQSSFLALGNNSEILPEIGSKAFNLFYKTLFERCELSFFNSENFERGLCGVILEKYPYGESRDSVIVGESALMRDRNMVLPVFALSGGNSYAAKNIDVYKIGLKEFRRLKEAAGSGNRNENRNGSGKTEIKIDVSGMLGTSRRVEKTTDVESVISALTDALLEVLGEEMM